MPLVTITGNAWDHSRAPVPGTLEPRLFFSPKQSRIAAGGLFADLSTQANLNVSTGAFSVQLESQPGMLYRAWMDHLQPGQELEQPADRTRGYIEWPYDILPDIGGPIGDLIEIIQGVGLVDITNAAPTTSSRYQLQYNPQTHWLYERRISW